MRLSDRQVHDYRENGLLLIESMFDAVEVEALREAFVRDSDVPGEQRILEDGGSAVRAIYSSHRRQPEFAALVRTSRVLGAVQQLLAADVYLYQFKINSKAPLAGGSWAWHQDYLAWRIADGLPAPRLLNVGVYLDDATEFNGPVLFVPGSHRHGLVQDGRRARSRSEQHLDPDDIGLTREQLTALVRRNGMVSPKGPAGSVLFFDPQVVHGSAPNMSPFPRKLLIATYNDVRNPPRGTPRPEYLVCRDTAALRVGDAALVGHAGATS